MVGGLGPFVSRSGVCGGVELPVACRPLRGGCYGFGCIGWLGLVSVCAGPLLGRSGVCAERGLPEDYGSGVAPCELRGDRLGIWGRAVMRRWAFLCLVILEYGLWIVDGAASAWRGDSAFASFVVEFRSSGEVPSSFESFPAASLSRFPSAYGACGGVVFVKGAVHLVPGVLVEVSPLGDS